MNTSSAPAWGSHQLPTADFIQRALDRIRADDAVEAELHNVRAYLLNILELVDRDPGIEAASDDLYAVANRSGRGRPGELELRQRLGHGGLEGGRVVAAEDVVKLERSMRRCGLALNVSTRARRRMISGALCGEASEPFRRAKKSRLRCGGFELEVCPVN